MISIDYPCPNCGSDGPHQVIPDDFDAFDSTTFECAECYSEVTVGTFEE